MQKFRIGGIALVLCTLVWGVGTLVGEVSPPQGELRIVDRNPNNWATITLNVFEHLMSLDHEGNLVPRLATRWRWLDDRTLEVTLRQGVKFHNGEVFDADIVKLNWDEQMRVGQPFRMGSFMNFKPGSHLQITDAHTVRFVFPEPDGGALGHMPL
jgi:peptide/nickel transport system substrate-binding protein